MLTYETSMNRHRLALAAAAVIVSAAGATSSATAAARPVKGAHEVAVLNRTSEAHAHPERGSASIQRVSGTRPITGEQTVLPVIAHHTSSNGASWLKVLLPGRPNSHTGWISSHSTTAEITNWQIIVRLSIRRVTVPFDDRARRRFIVVVGKPSTPTPQGHFFVEEDVALDPDAVGAPYGLALSARSNALQHFDGGPGQTALHGTNNIGGIPATAASHGCVRLSTANITWLAHHIGPGTLVTITR
jgi:lipoprotein-anchoring transpeptidase ErfK/SrfK